MPPRETQEQEPPATRKSSRTRIPSSRAAEAAAQEQVGSSSADVPDPEYPDPPNMPPPPPSQEVTPVVHPRSTLTPLTPNRPGQETAEDTDSVCQRHVRPVEHRLDRLEQTVNENPVPGAMTIPELLARISSQAQAATVQAPQPTTSTDTAMMNMVAEIRDTLPNITGTIDVLRKDVNHLMESGSAKRNFHQPVDPRSSVLNAQTEAEKQTEATKGPVIEDDVQPQNQPTSSRQEQDQAQSQFDDLVEMARQQVKKDLLAHGLMPIPTTAQQQTPTAPPAITIRETDSEDDDQAELSQVTAKKPTKQRTARAGSSHSRRTAQSKPLPRSGVSRRSTKTTATEKTEHDSTTDESDDELEQNEAEEDEEFWNVPFFERAKGPKHPGLSSLRSSDPMYDRLLSYRYYRLREKKAGVNAAGMIKLRIFMKSLDITMQGHRFDGSDPIAVFSFLIHFVTEADKLNMSEGQAYLAIPSYLKGSAKSQFSSMQNGIRAGGITCWPEAIQFFLRSYPTPNVIRNAISELMNIRQQPGEDESTYAGKLSTALARCGNVHDEPTIMTMFVNGLQPSIRTTVSRFREDHHRGEMTFARLTQEAQDVGNTFRLQMAQFHAGPARSTRAALARAAAAKAAQESKLQLIEPSLGQDEATADEDLLLVDLTPEADTSVNTDSLPSTADEQQAVEEALLLFRHRQRNNRNQQGGQQKTPTAPGNSPTLPIVDGRAQPVPIAHEQGNTPRVGWEAKDARIICHGCYVKDQHILPECTHSLTKPTAIIKNYEALSAKEKACLPDKYYIAAKTLVPGTAEHKLMQDVSTQSQQPPTPKK